MLTALRIATRNSPSALRQANFVRGRLLELYPGIDIALLKVQTRGDRYLDTPLGGLSGKGLFGARGAAEILRSGIHAAG
jgi:hydroxymethylbilane synthase